MEMPDFLFIQLGRDRGRTFIRKFDTKSPFDGATGYVNYDEYRRVYDELKKENEENCRLLGKSAEREIQLLQKVQQLENQVSCLMQNSESQTQTQIALIKKLESEKWQPIETAPKDERVLLWTGQEKYCGHWSKNPFTNHEAWIIAEWGNDGDQALLENPTHWMPLPDAPEQR